MSAAEPTIDPERPRLRRCQFSLRTLLLGVMIVAVVASAVSTMVWSRTRYPRQSRTWWNDWSETAGSAPHFFVWAKAINGEMPAIAGFARIDDLKRVEAPMPWLECDANDQVFIEGRHIPYRAGTLKLFVDEGDGRPTLVLLDADDAKRYFDRDNSYFTTYEAFVEFWENVLEKKYLRAPNKAPTPPAR